MEHYLVIKRNPIAFSELKGTAADNATRMNIKILMLS